MPAVWRERMAVGTYVRLVERINSPKPGRSFVQTDSVASGVTSRKAGPVPPEVIIRQHFLLSAMSIMVSSINGCSSGMTAYSFSHGLVKYSSSVLTIALPGMSS